jgi:gas vesicle protein
MFDRDENSSVGPTAVGLLIGFTLGLGVGLLFAPQAGHRTRKALSKNVNSALEGVKSSVDDLHESASDFLSRTISKVEAHRDAIVDLAESARKVAAKAIG